jgi:hypothetical protein
MAIPEVWEIASPAFQRGRNDMTITIYFAVPVGCGDSAFRGGTASIAVFANDAVHFADHIVPFCAGQSTGSGFRRGDEWQHAITFGKH